MTRPVESRPSRRRAAGVAAVQNILRRVFMDVKMELPCRREQTNNMAELEEVEQVIWGGVSGMSAEISYVSG